MSQLKPKDVANKIGITPSKVSVLAQEIEASQLYSFTKTPLGSFLFFEKDIELLKEYSYIRVFFREKNERFQMLKHKIEELSLIEEEKPDWMKHLKNARFFKKQKM